MPSHTCNLLCWLLYILLWIRWIRTNIPRNTVWNIESRFHGWWQPLPLLKLLMFKSLFQPPICSSLLEIIFDQITACFKVKDCNHTININSYHSRLPINSILDLDKDDPYPPSPPPYKWFPKPHWIHQMAWHFQLHQYITSFCLPRFVSMWYPTQATTRWHCTPLSTFSELPLLEFSTIIMLPFQPPPTYTYPNLTTRNNINTPLCLFHPIRTK